MDLEDKVTFEEGGSVSYMDIWLDSERVKKLIELWVAKGMMSQEEAQSGSQIKSKTTPLLSHVQVIKWSRLWQKGEFELLLEPATSQHGLMTTYE